MSLLLLRSSHFFKHLSLPRLIGFATTTRGRRNLSSRSVTASASGSYLSVDIQSPQDVADTLSEALLCFGALSTTVSSSSSNNNNQQQKISCCIVSIFCVSHDVHQSIALAADSIGLKQTPLYKVTTAYHSDWIQNARESFHPVQVTKGLWIVPEWMEDIQLQAAATTVITLNPGLAFGTGDHPTTKLCLLLLLGLIKGGETVLDYGTGSGILAIAALKFGAASAVGLDIDPEAITAAHHNAALNNIKLELQVVPSNISPEWEWGGMKTSEYDVVVANILLNPLLDLAHHIVSYAKPGGVVALSGIISEQVPTVVERYSNLLEGMSVSQIDDWACIRGTKRKIG